MLLDDDQGKFCASVLAILTNDSIRFHLKCLVFNSVKELIHKTVRLLSSVAEKAPNTVLKELKPFIGKSVEWNYRVYNGLNWNLENDSDAMFEVRKELINLGCNARHIQWKILAKKLPNRALDLIEMLLYHYKDVLNAPRYSDVQKVGQLTNRDTWSDSELDELTNITLEIPEEALSRLLAIVSDFTAKQEHYEATNSWLYEDQYSSYDDATSCITQGIFSIIESAGERLGNNPGALFK